MTLGIYIPTYKRPDALQRVADNLKATTRSSYWIYWGIEPDDKESIKAAKKTGWPVILNKGEATYSDALQSIYEATREPIFLWGNDDFHFLDGWDEKPLEMMKNDPDIGVLGLDDGNPNTNWTAISLVRRKYIEEQSGVVDMPNRVLFPYNHNYVDNELTETAQHRGAWDKCPDPCIQHQHPSFTWLGEFEVDETYERNQLKDAEDANLFHSRRHLWS